MTTAASYVTYFTPGKERRGYAGVTRGGIVIAEATAKMIRVK